jgi:hypothetical protein
MLHRAQGAAPRNTQRSSIRPGQVCNSFRNALPRVCGNFTTNLIFLGRSTREAVSFKYSRTAASSMLASGRGPMNAGVR